MATATLSPVAIQQFFDNNGKPLAGGKLYFFIAGTDFPTPAYADPGMLVPLQNPLILDSAGRAPEIFLGPQSYKLMLTTSLGVGIWTADNVISAALLSQQANAPSVTTVNTTAIQHNLATGTNRNRLVVCTQTGDVIITGFADGHDGDVLTVLAGSSGNVFLADQNNGSFGANQLVNFIKSGHTPLAAGYGTAQYMYFAAIGRWKIITHDQGHSLPIAYDALHYLATTGAWTVPEASVFNKRYFYNGAQVNLQLAIGPTAITATPQFLGMTGWPFKFVSGIPLRATMQGYDPSIAAPKEFAFLGSIEVGDQGTMYLRRIDFTSAWPALPTFSFWGQATFEVE